MSEAGYIEFLDDKYQFLKRDFPTNKIYLRYKMLLDDTVKTIKNLKLGNVAYIDENSFQMIIIDYFTDIAKLKHFQDIEHTNVAKIYAYSMYWFIRRHPVHLNINAEFNFDKFDINERIALAIFFPKLLKEAGIKNIDAPQNEKIKIKIIKLYELLLYNIKYRTYTQQSLELMMEAFLCGSACGSVIEK